MANVFLDTNILIDLIERGTWNLTDFADHNPYLSPLSVHILAYVYRYDIPSTRLELFTEELNIADLTEQILKLALVGPTSDLEDNIQLHSAAHSDCDLFVTNDKKILAMKFFGKVKIVSSL